MVIFIIKIINNIYLHLRFAIIIENVGCPNKHTKLKKTKHTFKHGREGIARGRTKLHGTQHFRGDEGPKQSQFLPNWVVYMSFIGHSFTKN